MRTPKEHPTLERISEALEILLFVGIFSLGMVILIPGALMDILLHRKEKEEKASMALRAVQFPLRYFFFFPDLREGVEADVVGINIQLNDGRDYTVFVPAFGIKQQLGETPQVQFPDLLWTHGEFLAHRAVVTVPKMIDLASFLVTNVPVQLNYI